MTNNICSYVDTSLQGQMDTWHLSNKDVQNTVTVNVAGIDKGIKVSGIEGEVTVKSSPGE